MRLKDDNVAHHAVEEGELHPGGGLGYKVTEANGRERDDAEVQRVQVRPVLDGREDGHAEEQPGDADEHGDLQPHFRPSSLAHRQVQTGLRTNGAESGPSTGMQTAAGSSTRTAHCLNSIRSISPEPSSISSICTDAGKIVSTGRELRAVARNAARGAQRRGTPAA